MLALVLLATLGLPQKIEDRIAREPAGTVVSVAYVDTSRGIDIEIRSGEVVHAASTMKLAVMMEAYRQASMRVLDLDEPVLVENTFKSIVDGTPFEIDAADDSDRWTFQQLGKKVPLRTLIDRSIVRSSNLATNLVIDRVGAANVTSFCVGLGAKDTRVLRGVEDGKAFRAGLNNVTTAHDLAVLLRAIGDRKTPGAEAMIDVLSRQELNEGIPAGLPRGTRVAHKTGSITKVSHDAALVLGEAPFVLVVTTKGLDEKTATRLIADIARIVFESR